MSVSDDRELAIINEARELRDFYKSQGQKTIVRLFTEDYDFLKKRKAIHPAMPVGDEIGGLDSVNIIRGQRKKRVRMKRPPSSMF